MTHILAIANQKGGVGKTTTALNLAASLAHSYKRVLLIDIDPQGNATTGSGFDKQELKNTVLQVLMNKADIQDVILHSEAGKYDMLAANGSLSSAEVELINELMREQRLRHALMKIQHKYDYILIDCPPSLNMLSINALVASTGVIIPVQCEFFSLEGISALVGTIEKIAKMANKGLIIEGIVQTMYDPRSMLTMDVERELKEYFGDRVFKSSIPRNVRLAEAPSHGLPALAYDKNSKGSIAYMGLAGELIRRHKPKVRVGSEEHSNGH